MTAVVRRPWSFVALAVACSTYACVMNVFKRRGERDNTSRPLIRIAIIAIKIETFST